MPDLLATDLTAVNLKVEYLPNPLGLDVFNPRFNWSVQGQGRNRKQSAYQITVLSQSNPPAVVWDTKKVVSSDTLHIAYQGLPLKPKKRYTWQVRIWDEKDRGSRVTSSWWETGMLHQEEWSAKWIGSAGKKAGEQEFTDRSPPETELAPGVFIRKVFNLNTSVKRARLYASALGLYMPFINGRRISPDLFTPGWTDYTQRLTYQTYDITPYLLSGSNALGVILGEGWYSGSVGFRTKKPRHHYGDHPLFIAQIEWVDEKGCLGRVVSDGTWRYQDKGPIRYSDFLAGEYYDARCEMPGWASEPFDEGNWENVQEAVRIKPVPLYGEKTLPVRITEMRLPQNVRRFSALRQIVDFGQNMAGWVRIKVKGPTGARLQLRFAEMLTEEKELYTANFRSAKNTDTFILRGDGVESWEPHFTIHGFRYVEISSNSAEVCFEQIAACVIHNDLPGTGEFQCSSEMVNQLQRNIQWSQRSNFVSIPTDCPQRDERLGWLADAHIFARTAMFNMDVSSFFTKWLDDVKDAQSPEGAFSVVAPRLVDEGDGAPGWGDAGIILPWTMYLVYGDRRILEVLYPAMAKWLDYIGEVNPQYLWVNRRNHDFGDWLALGEETPKELIATAFWAYDACLMSRIAKILGKSDEARSYRSLFRRIQSAFVDAFVAADGEIQGNTESAYAMALFMHLLPRALRQNAGKKLVSAIKDRHNHVSTGFLGISYLLPALSHSAHDEVAYQLLLNTTYPSWGYQILNGATTLWERWNGWTRNQGFHPSDLNSFNHYAFGSVGDWLYRFAAGIDTDPRYPGYQHIVIRPRIGPLNWVKASYDSIHGRITVFWTVAGNDLTLDVSIPVNTTATIYFPLTEDRQILEDELSAAKASGVLNYRRNSHGTIIDIGSGHYHFVSER